MTKRILVSILVVSAIPLAVFMSIVMFCFVFTVAVNLIYPSPDVPEIREAEFPFEIVYEYKGKLVEVEDIYVCKYDGVNTNAAGKFRCWDEYFKSGNEDVLEVFKDDTTEVGISIGSAQYYMGDPNYSTKNEEKTPSAYRITRDDSLIYTEPLSEEELYSEYGIKIISWELSKPIENTFAPKKWYEFWKR